MKYANLKNKKQPIDQYSALELQAVNGRKLLNSSNHSISIVLLFKQALHHERLLWIKKKSNFGLECYWTGNQRITGIKSTYDKKVRVCGYYIAT